jgi:hypothetical protein
MPHLSLEIPKLAGYKASAVMGAMWHAVPIRGAVEVVASRRGSTIAIVGSVRSASP